MQNLCSNHICINGVCGGINSAYFGTIANGSSRLHCVARFVLFSYAGTNNQLRSGDLAGR